MVGSIADLRAITAEIVAGLLSDFRGTGTQPSTVIPAKAGDDDYADRASAPSIIATALGTP